MKRIVEFTVTLLAVILAIWVTSNLYSALRPSLPASLSGTEVHSVPVPSPKEPL